ncbi:alpha-soluble NSF attachment protein-like, partial [Onychostruthus taczanowskii]|uniref:alpha-soluble NSF attachment protein-like n=1 Tax=Onychostruthus taczanowskii TaxID=356909 RepID=UPI001B805A9D
MAAMAAEKEAEAQRLLSEAERKVRGAQSFLGGLFGCVRAARAGRRHRGGRGSPGGTLIPCFSLFPEAGAAFSRVAQLQLQLQSKHDAATNFVDAGHAFKKADPQEAVNCLLRAIEIYTDMGRFTIAAKHHVCIAEIYESDLLDIQKAVAHYEQAADYYRGEESTSSANKCLLKVAAYAAQLEQFPRAIDIYEQVGPSSPPLLL